MNLTIAVGVIAAVAAGLACLVAHPIAKRHRWKYLERYATGVTIGHVAYAFVIFTAGLPIEVAAVLYGLLWLVYGGEGLATWHAHDSDPDPRPRSLTPDADKLLRDIDEELRK